MPLVYSIPAVVFRIPSNKAVANKTDNDWAELDPEETYLVQRVMLVASSASLGGFPFRLNYTRNYHQTSAYEENITFVSLFIKDSNISKILLTESAPDNRTNRPTQLFLYDNIIASIKTTQPKIFYRLNAIDEYRFPNPEEKARQNSDTDLILALLRLISENKVVFFEETSEFGNKAQIEPISEQQMGVSSVVSSQGNLLEPGPWKIYLELYKAPSETLWFSGLIQYSWSSRTILKKSFGPFPGDLAVSVDLTVDDEITGPLYSPRIYIADSQQKRFADLNAGQLNLYDLLSRKRILFANGAVAGGFTQEFKLMKNGTVNTLFIEITVPSKNERTFFYQCLDVASQQL